MVPADVAQLVFQSGALLLRAEAAVDVHIKTVEDIEDKYDLVVLGTIPNMFTNNTSSGGAEYE